MLSQLPVLHQLPSRECNMRILCFIDAAAGVQSTGGALRLVRDPSVLSPKAVTSIPGSAMESHAPGGRFREDPGSPTRSEACGSVYLARGIGERAGAARALFLTLRLV